MTIKECYCQAGGTYDVVAARIGNEARIEKYLRKLLTDESYQNMLTALEQENWEQAFLCAHNLKGLCSNLALDPAAQAASVLCESLRHGAPAQDITPLRQELVTAYTRTLTAVNRLFAEV